MNAFQFVNSASFARRTLCLAVLCVAAFVAKAGDAPGAMESRGRVTLADGSLLQCMIAYPVPWTITTVGGVQTLKIDALDFIEFGERVDPNVENDANVAVGDLQNDNFETREKAEAKLRGMGRAAAKALKQALTIPDAEVTKRVRALLIEIGAVGDDGLQQDRVHLRDGTILRGELAFADVSVRSHFGRLRVPIEALESLGFTQPAGDAPDASLAAIDSKEIMVPLPAATHVESAAAQHWDPNDDGRFEEELSWLEEAQRNALTMDKVTDPKAAVKTLIATKAGDRLENAYADRGVALRATEAASTVEVSGEKMRSFSAGRCLIAKNSDVEIRFTLPASKGAVPAGALHVGAIVRNDGPGTIGMAAYDAAGRLLIQTLNGGTNGNGQGGARDEFIGVRSKTPIARVRVYRVAAMKAKGADVLIDDIVFDRLTGAGLHENQCRVATSGGDRLVGKALDGAKNSIALKVDFLGEQAEPIVLNLALVSSYEPARGQEAKVADALGDRKNDAPRPRRFGLSHGVLLQSGETFRAHLFALDDTIAVFGLARGAVLKLPRETLRKIDLSPEPTPPGEASAPTAVAPDEKFGVEFRTKPRFNDPAVPQPKEEKKDPANNPAQGLPRMDNAQIVRVDPETHELTAKDYDGEMTMNVAGIKALVFPPNPNAAARDKKRAWTLTLREGSHFDADLLRIGALDISAEMAGGTVLLPADTVSRIERK